ncbi:MAG: DUF262 domain-containing HNH endonuclease family protein [Bacteroidota bacterium]
MKNNFLDTNTSNIEDIFGNGKIYRVPLYQRDYSWKLENWEDLWIDIEETASTDYPHYMGAIVLQNSKDKSFIIIDGQQRLATISIAIVASIYQIKKLIHAGTDKAQNEERVELLMRKYIGTKSAASLKYSSKLFLNENNDSFYQSTLLQFKKPINYRKLSDSDKLLWDAFYYFDQQLSSKFSTDFSGAKIAAFIDDFLSTKLVFIQITVDDDLSAYTVFETLNSRGIGLTSTDLLKNFLFSKVAASKTDLDHVKHQWKKIIDIIGLNEFPAFLRHYTNSFDLIVTKDKLFKRLKTKIKQANAVFELLDALEQSAYLYYALEKPADEFWEDYTEYNIKDTIRELNLFKVKQYKSLVIAAFQYFDKSNFVKALKICTVISFRYNIIGRLNANDLEKVYNKAAIAISKKEVAHARDLAHALKSVYVDDEVFANTFSTKTLNTRNQKKLIRYILVKLEVQMTSKDFDFEETAATIEHILPESIEKSEYWQSYFSEDEHANLVNRLGNLSLLEPRLNRTAANQDFEQKKEIYQESQYEMTKQVEMSEWNPQLLKRRQARLAKVAKSIWKIQF